jgi:Protein of unknown function (DUF1214)
MPLGSAARLLGLSMQSLELGDGRLGVCEHAGERRLHPRVSQVIADPACGVEPGLLHIQNDMPGRGTSNWLPAPEGGFSLCARLYYPKPEALDGTWMPPAVTRAYAPSGTSPGRRGPFGAVWLMS